MLVKIKHKFINPITRITLHLLIWDNTKMIMVWDQMNKVETTNTKCLRTVLDRVAIKELDKNVLTIP